MVMTKHALIDSVTGADKGKRQKFEGAPPDESRKGVKWIPFVEVNADIADPLTQRLGPRSKPVWSMDSVTVTREAVEIPQSEQDATAERKEFMDAVQSVRVILKDRADELKLHEGDPGQRLKRMETYLSDTMMYTRRILKESFGE